MAHMLANHAGKCKNIHGHTYSMQVEIYRNDENVIHAPGSTDHGMVMEFYDLKTIIQELIVEPLDHAFVFWSESTDPLEHGIAALLKEHQRKLVSIDYRPTAENLAADFYHRINHRLKSEGVSVRELILWESPTSFARIREE